MRTMNRIAACVALLLFSGFGCSALAEGAWKCVSQSGLTEYTSNAESYLAAPEKWSCKEQQLPPVTRYDSSHIQSFALNRPADDQPKGFWAQLWEVLWKPADESGSSEFASVTAEDRASDRPLPRMVGKSCRRGCPRQETSVMALKGDQPFFMHSAERPRRRIGCGR